MLPPLRNAQGRLRHAQGRPVAGFLLDLDGTLYTGDRAIPGAADVIGRLRKRNTPFRLVTNTSSRSRAEVVQRLASFGIDATANELMTAPLAASAVLLERGHRVVAPFLNPSTLQDLADMKLVGGTARAGTEAGASSPKVTAVLIGDLGRGWTYDLLQEAYSHLREGAELFACSRDRVYRSGTGLVLDAGPFVAALEYAANCSASITGKPSASFYRAAIASLGLQSGARVAMVGDDLHADVRGAQAAGCEGWLVLSGKTSRDTLASADIKPDRVLVSIAELESEASK